MRHSALAKSPMSFGETGYRTVKNPDVLVRDGLCNCLFDAAVKKVQQERQSIGASMSQRRDQICAQIGPYPFVLKGNINATAFLGKRPGWKLVDGRRQPVDLMPPYQAPRAKAMAGSSLSEPLYP